MRSQREDTRLPRYLPRLQKRTRRNMAHSLRSRLALRLRSLHSAARKGGVMSTRFSRTPSQLTNEEKDFARKLSKACDAIFEYANAYGIEHFPGLKGYGFVRTALGPWRELKATDRRRPELFFAIPIKARPRRAQTKKK
jgi:hypothetical protein